MGQAADAPGELIGATDRERKYAGSTSGAGVTTIDENAATGKTMSWLSPAGTEVNHMGMYRGVEGEAKVASLSLAQCQCDPDTIQSELRIVAATYGANCHSTVNNAGEAPNGRDMTKMLQAACNGNTTCNFVMDHSVTGDPASWCHKDLKVDYMCSGGYTPCPYVIANQPDPVRLTECREIIPDAKDKTLSISCPQAAAKQECLANRAACGRCALDAVARTSVTVVGRAEGEVSMRNEYTAWQDTEGTPGFEFSIN